MFEISKCLDKLKFEFSMKKETKDKHFIKKPYYKGGNEALKSFVNEHLKYPKKAFEEQMEGTVVVRYEINHKGNVVNAKIISSLSKECDKEAIRVVRLLNFVVPKSYKARVSFHKSIQIHFKMPKSQPEQSNPVAQQIQYKITPSEKSSTPKEKPKSTSYNYSIRF